MNATSNQVSRALLVTFSLLVSSNSFGTFHEDFVHKYAELNIGNWGHSFFEFPDSSDRINALNKSLSISVPLGISYPVGADFRTQMTLHYGSNIWAWSENGGVVSAKPRANFFGAGIGFQLGFGRLMEPTQNPYGLWMYEAPNGKLYRFYDNLAGEPPVADVYYSRDEIKLRLKKVDSLTMSLEFLSGEVQLYRKQEGGWEIFKRHDQFGNYQQFSYRLDLNRVTTSDNHGRIQWIHFKSDPAGHYPRVIDKIRLRRIGGVSVYVFNYTTQSIATPSEDTDPATPANVTLPVLTSISYPLGENNEFTYHGSSNVGAGRLRNYTNTFGGTIEYTYSEIDMPYVQNPQNLAQSMDHFAADVIGVTSRKAFDVGNVLLGTWSFTNMWHGGSRFAPPSLSQPTGMISIMTQPDGFQHRRYFRTPIKDIAVTSPQAHNNTKSEYGFRGLVNDWENAYESSIDSTVTHEYYRANSVFSCGNCLDPVIKVTKNLSRQVGGYLKRKTFSGHDWTGNPTETNLLNNWTVVSTTTVERDLSMPSVNELWLSKKPTQITKSEGGLAKTTEQCVNNLDQITRKRSIRGSAQGANDFIQEYLFGAAGNNIEARFFGGDDNAVPTGDLCTISLTAPPFRKFKEFSYGTVSRSGYLNADGTVFSENYTATVAANTGLSTANASEDGLFRTYTYDKLNRIVSVTMPPGQGATFKSTYTPASASANATIRRQYTSQDGTTINTDQLQVFNGFGQVTSISITGPGGVATTSKAYDAMGRLLTSTEADGGVTQYLNRDYQGRVGIQRPPEGSIHDTSFSYTADKEVTEVYSIAKDLSVIPPVESIRAVTRGFDILGRTTSQIVTDEDGAVRNRATTYDINGHWVTKSENGITISNLEQFDAQGRLTQNSYGSPITYNAMGQKLERYSRFGDRIDYVYDRAGRRIAEFHDGALYGEYAYAAANSPGQYNKGKLTYARRINRNVPDVPGKVISVLDHFEYGGAGGRVDSRRTELADNTGGVFVSYASSADYNDLGQIVTLYSPACTETATFDCSGNAQTGKQYMSNYNLGRLVNVTEGGENLISQIQYDSQGRPTSYLLGNGLLTDIEYQPGIEQASKVTVRDGGVQLWSSGLADLDGRAQVTNYGIDQYLPDGFYETTTLRTQPTAYEQTMVNSSFMPDPYGQMIDRATPACEGAYPPCKNISIYNFKSELVWFRQRPISWPSSPTGMKTPSRLYLFDLIGRQAGAVHSNTAYVNDRNNYTISLTMTYSGYLFDEQINGHGFLIGIRANEFQFGTFYHSDLNNGPYGESDSDGNFTSSFE